MERNKWSELQDKVLIEIVSQEMEPIRWNKVSERFTQRVGSKGRSGKQCRQRWRNNLNPIFDSESWTIEEEEIMIREQNLRGNKWAEISKLLHNRTDIYIKNQFFALFRKLTTKINKGLVQLSKTQLKQSLINNVLMVNNLKFSEICVKSDSLIELSQQIRQLILSFRGQQSSGNLQQRLLKLNILCNQFKTSFDIKRPKKKKQVEEDSQGQEIIIKKHVSKTRSIPVQPITFIKVEADSKDNECKIEHVQSEVKNHESKQDIIRIERNGSQEIFQEFERFQTGHFFQPVFNPHQFLHAQFVRMENFEGY